MRSIGKRNIALVKKVCNGEINKHKSQYGNLFGFPDLSSVEEKVIEQLPSKLWDTWEMADSEIRRIINDEIYHKL